MVTPPGILSLMNNIAKSVIQSADRKRTVGYTGEAMLCNEVSDDPAFAFDLLNATLPNVLTGAWVVQEKYDGKRLVVAYGPRPVYLNRGGGPTNMPSPEVGVELQSFSRMLSGTVFDGELVLENGSYRYYLYDIIRDGEGNDVTSLPLYERAQILEDLVCRVRSDVGDHEFQRVRIAPWYGGDKGKEMIDQWHSEGAEGFVLKHIPSAYCSGRPSSGGPWIKFKWVSTATVRCAGRVPDSWSFKMEVMDDAGNWVPCGDCTVPWNMGFDMDLDFPVDSLWEVRYLYATHTHTLYQPRISPAGRRDDLPMSAAKRSQFRYRKGALDRASSSPEDQ